MKTTRITEKIVLTGLLMLSIAVATNAQTKKKNQVRVKVVSSEGDKVIEMDTTFNHDVFVFTSGDKAKVINIDSIMEAHHHDMDKHMRVMAYKMDSLNDFHFEFDGDMEKMHIEMEKLLKEKGIQIEELEHLHDAHRNRIVIMQGKDGEVDIEEFINDDGDKIKIIKKEICEKEGGEHGVKTFMIASGNEDIPIHWKEKHKHSTTVKIESIPMEDITFLKKIGITSKKLMSEPLQLDDIKVKIEKIMEDEKLQTLMHIECELPEGKYHLEMFNQNGNKVKEEKDISSGPMKQEFDLIKEEAPYYLILSKNNQLFGRKIVL